MDNDTLRMLFISLREDIADLKRDVNFILEKHDADIEEIKSFKWRWIGGLSVIILLLEVGVNLLVK